VLPTDLAAEQRVVEPGADQQAGHAAQPRQAVFVVDFVQPRVPEAGRRAPADAQVVEFGQPDVHRPVDQDVEPQPAAGAELQHPDAPLGSVVQHDCPHAARGGQVPGVPRDRSREAGPEGEAAPAGKASPGSVLTPSPIRR
jgi:hypothetical protein